MNHKRLTTLVLVALLVMAVLEMCDAAPAASMALADYRSADSAPIVFRHYDAGTETNVRAVLNANGGAMRTVIVPAGAKWEFGDETDNLNDVMDQLVVSGGVLGGGLGDLASRYAQAARRLNTNVRLVFEQAYPPIMDVEPENSVSLWMTGSEDGELDLEVYNDTESTLVFVVIDDGSQVTVRAVLTH